MSLVGNLEDLSLPDILQIVSLSKKSGILMLEREGQQGKIIIRRGKVIQTVSSRPGKTLGELLTGRGLVRPEDLRRALEVQRGGGGKELLGSILVQQKLIDLASLERIVQEQIEDAIVFFLSWKEGTFSFELADIAGRGEFSVDPQAFILEHGIDTQWLVLEGTRLIDERAREQGQRGGAEEAAHAGSAETSFADVAAEAPRALVLVDDDDGFREGARAAFSGLGFRVLACGGVADGLRALAAEGGVEPPPLLVTDVVMPTADSRGFLGGIELLERARREHPAVPVAAITAYPDENVRARVLELGGGFFLKPPGGGEAALAAFAGQVAAALAGAAAGPPGEALPGAAAAEEPPAALPGPQPPPRQAPAATAPEGAPRPEPAAASAAAGPSTGGGEHERLLDALRETRAALARQDETVAAAGVGPDELPLLRDMLAELQLPRATSEIGLLILRFAAEVMNRAVLFVVKGGRAVGLGGFGVEAPGGAAGGVRGIAIPLEEPSLIGDAVRGRAPVRGAPAETPWNRALLEQLGGRWPAEAVAIPLVSGGRARVVLYGDNLPEGRPLAGIEALGVFLRQAGLTLEKVLLERRLQEVPAPPAPGGGREAQRVGGAAR